ncbi:hypothetical protein ACM66B_002429 [Microbotryomycetes sp. NB124-2]
MSDLNAKTRQETQAQGPDTFGCLNQHPLPANHETDVQAHTRSSTTLAEFEVKGTLQFLTDTRASTPPSGVASTFTSTARGSEDGPATPVPDSLNSTFHVVDTKLSELASAEGTHSGCTAAVVFLRLEDEDGNPVGEASGVGKAVQLKTGKVQGEPDGALKAAQAGEGTELQRVNGRQTSDSARDDGANVDGAASLLGSSGSTNTDIKNKIRSVLSGGRSGAEASTSEAETRADSPQRPPEEDTQVKTPDVEVRGPAEVKKAAKRTLYTANVGDARAVLSRGGRAVRLTYDHKGSDAKEAKRITDAGGFVMNNRVNGVLAVTRSLGDSSMKEFVVGSPYTTETSLGPGDDFLIVACDGCLWDVCQDQEAVDLIKDAKDPQEASRILLEHALSNFSSDNLSVLVVALNHDEPPTASAAADS